MAKYLILIYENEEGYATVVIQTSGGPRWKRTRDSPNRSLRWAARCSAAKALQPTATATSVRDDIVTDGPFVETKEALGGYYLIEASDLDQALAIAKACPAPYGGVEVRPIMEFAGG